MATFGPDASNGSYWPFFNLEALSDKPTVTTKDTERERVSDERLMEMRAIFSLATGELGIDAVAALDELIAIRAEAATCKESLQVRSVPADPVIPETMSEAVYEALRPYVENGDRLVIFNLFMKFRAALVEEQKR